MTDQRLSPCISTITLRSPDGSDPGRSTSSSLLIRYISSASPPSKLATRAITTSSFSRPGPEVSISLEAGPRRAQDLLDGRAQGLRHVAVACREPANGLARLPAAPRCLHARDRLEVGCQHDDAPLAGDLLDLPVDDALRLDG